MWVGHGHANAARKMPGQVAVRSGDVETSRDGEDRPSGGPCAPGKARATLGRAVEGLTRVMETACEEAVPHARAALRCPLHYLVRPSCRKANCLRLPPR